MAQPRIIEQKEYDIQLWRDGSYIASLGRICRDLSWTANRNPQIGYNKINFKVDQWQFGKWCETHHVDARTMVTKTKTECKIRVRNTRSDPWVWVACGYLYKDPTLSANSDAWDLNFEFIDYFYYLAGWLIPNGTRYDSWSADSVVVDLVINKAEREGHWGFQRGLRPTLPNITREYSDWKPVGEAIADMLDNETGAGQFDVWVDQDKKLNIAKPRMKNSGLNFYYPYNPAVGEIPITEISYDDPPELATRIVGTGEGQGDAAITATAQDTDAIAKYGYITAYVQYSSITNVGTLQQKVQAELDSRLNPDPAPTITVPGVFIDWSKFTVGDMIHFTNDTAVFYGLGGDVRVKTIEVTTDANRAETVKLITEQWNG